MGSISYGVDLRANQKYGPRRKPGNMEVRRANFIVRIADRDWGGKIEEARKEGRADEPTKDLLVLITK